MIKTITSIALIIGCQLALTPAAFAAKAYEDCELAELSLSEKSSCLDDVKKSIDRELQTWVNNHIFNLEEKALTTGRHSALKMFKRSQSNFITFRDNNCRWQYLTISPNKGADIAYKQCYVRVTQNRIKELSLAH